MSEFKGTQVPSGLKSFDKGNPTQGALSLKLFIELGIFTQDGKLTSLGYKLLDTKQLRITLNVE